MSNLSFKAVIFDLDGVITQTALVHSQAWKQMFDEYLKTRETMYNEPFKEFTHNKDYLIYVNGKPRYEGVKSFLHSRNIHISYGISDDTPETETICGLGNRKNQLFNDFITRGKVNVFSTSILFIKELRKHGIKIGVASSSKNCKAILEAVDLMNLFDTRVDGIISSELNLKGKPEPDIFTTACDNLGISYSKSVVVEDAVSGVQAGRNGHFGLVIGVAREENAIELKKNGADIVVSDLGELTIKDIQNWFTVGLKKDQWILNYFDYNNDKNEERKREALCTIGNGYLGTRGVMEEFDDNGISYPGTYIAGVYNKIESEIAGRVIFNEDLVNCPNWLPITFKMDNGNWFSLKDYEITELDRTVNFKEGYYSKRMIIQDYEKRKTRIITHRLASMNDCHLVALRYEIMPLNYSAKTTIKSAIDGTVINSGVDRYKRLNSVHLKPINGGGKNTLSFLLVETTQSKIKIAEAAKLHIFVNKKPISPNITVSYDKNGKIESQFTIDAKLGNVITIEKIVRLDTSKDTDILGENSILEKTKNRAKTAPKFDKILEESKQRWSEIWKKIDISVEGDRIVQKLLRMHMFHLLVTASPNNAKMDVGIPARGLHGEAYRGHIFWDTMFILPFYNIHFPDIAKSALMYRYRRLDEARKYAKKHGYDGAMFPWQSGSSGEEETQTLHLNPISGEWGPDYSPLQRHVSLAIAYNLWNYYWVTEDEEFLENYGAEIFFDICKFWAGKASLNTNGRYEIRNVMGPDEFHEMFPESQEEGLKDNFYTNIMVIWTFTKAFDILNILSMDLRKSICSKLNLTKNDFQKWKDITKKISLIISDEGVFSQFDGYFNLKELNWSLYKEKYENIHRMDRILKAEGKSPDEYKVSKQADVLMTFYNLHPTEVEKLLTELGYNVSNDFIEKNFNYYINRTSHGSTLSKIVYSYLLNLLDRSQESYILYLDGLMSDYLDVQGGTTGEGIHTGVMAGTILGAIITYAGIEMRKEIIHINPNLPSVWRKIKFNFSFKGVRYYCEISNEKVRVSVESSVKKNVLVNIFNQNYALDTSIDRIFECDKNSWE